MVDSLYFIFVIFALLFSVFGEVSCDSALQIRQPAVHPANEALTEQKDQNPCSFPFLWHPCANSSGHKAPVVLTHTPPHALYMCRPSMTLMQSMLWCWSIFLSKYLCNI